MLFPKLMTTFKVSFLSQSITTFFRKAVHDTMTFREKQGIVRPDMINLLLQAKRGEPYFKSGIFSDLFLNHSLSCYCLLDISYQRSLSLLEFKVNFNTKLKRKIRPLMDFPRCKNQLLVNLKLLASGPMMNCVLNA